MMTAFFQSALIQTAGWVLIHSLWQLAFIAACIWPLLLKTRTAAARHLICCAGMLAMVLFPIATFIFLSGNASSAGLSLTSTPQATSTVDFSHIPPSNGQLNTAAPARSNSLATALSYLVLLYAIGSLACGAYLAGGYLRLFRLRSGSIPASRDLMAIFQSVAARAGRTFPVRLLQSALVEVPAVLGILRPVILLPLSMATTLSEEQIAALLAHELAHIQRLDPLINALQSAIEALLFYHPAVWWLSARLRQERELACDDQAMRIIGNRVTYAQALTAMESARAPAHVALAANSGQLLARIRHALEAPHHARRRATLLSIILPVAMLTAILYIGCDHSPGPTAPSATSTAQIAAATAQASPDVTSGVTSATVPATVDAILCKYTVALVEDADLAATPGAPAQGAPTTILPENAALTDLFAKLSEKGKLDILSRPYILVTNGQPAKITVGQKIPAGTDAQGQVIYSDTGITIGNVATRTADGLIAVDIDFHLRFITDEHPPATAPAEYPVIEERSFKTRVALKEGQTVIMTTVAPPGTLDAAGTFKSDGKPRTLLISLTVHPASKP